MFDETHNSNKILNSLSDFLNIFHLLTLSLSYAQSSKLKKVSGLENLVNQSHRSTKFKYKSLKHIHLNKLITPSSKLNNYNCSV